MAKINQGVISFLLASSATLCKLLVGLCALKWLALQFGTAGVGLAANFMTILTVLSALSGAGIVNGVTKYVAQFATKPLRLNTLIATSNWLILTVSGLIALFFSIFATQISQWLFYRTDYQSVIYSIACCQFAVALSSYTLAILKGIQAVKFYAISVITGALLGFIAFALAIVSEGYQGALCGLAFLSALGFIPASYFIYQQKIVWWQWRFFSWKYCRRLLKFSVMTLVTVCTIPVGTFLLRDLLAQHSGLEAVGLWQAMSKFSDAYLQCITVFFSLSLLPQLAKLTDTSVIKLVIVKQLTFTLLLMILLVFILFFTRKTWIILLYSEQFLPIEKFLVWQLFGDIGKALSYILGYVIIAKGWLKGYIGAEILQMGLLLFFGYLLIPSYRIEGAVQAYAITYWCYFFCCFAGLLRYLTHDKKG